jgi:hypothetical protein
MKCTPKLEGCDMTKQLYDGTGYDSRYDALLPKRLEWLTTTRHIVIELMLLNLTFKYNVRREGNW